MKQIDKIIESQEAPKDKNVLWIKGDKLLSHVNGKWTPVGGGSSDNVQGGGSSSGGNMEYWDVTAAPGGASEISPFLLLLKYTRNESQYIQSIVSIRSTGVTPIAVALDRSVKVANSKDKVLTVGEYFQQMGFSDFSAAGWVQITEEEFYTI